MTDESKPKPPLGLTPRDFWFRDRVLDCLEALQRYADQDDWQLFKVKAVEFAGELHYAVNEWDKYYPEVKKDD
jgi:hypothetical protein